MTTTTTQFIADDTATTDFDEMRTDVSTGSSAVSVERTDMAYVGELSLTGVCRLNRCCALRVGYQVLYMNGIYLADDAFLNTSLDSDDLFLHGWHAGFEYRR